MNNEKKCNNCLWVGRDTFIMTKKKANSFSLTTVEYCPSCHAEITK